MENGDQRLSRDPESKGRVNMNIEILEIDNRQSEEKRSHGLQDDQKKQELRGEIVEGRDEKSGPTENEHDC